jgi:hypothetical protein
LLIGRSDENSRARRVSIIALASCATDYQPQGFTGGYSDYLTAPDEAVITFHGNGYTPPERVGEMASLRCAEVTLEHGYKYFIITAVSDLSGSTSFTTPGYAHSYGQRNRDLEHRDRHRDHYLHTPRKRTDFWSPA